MSVKKHPEPGPSVLSILKQKENREALTAEPHGKQTSAMTKTDYVMLSDSAATNHMLSTWKVASETADINV